MSVTIYELVNPRLRQVFVGLTGRSPGEMARRLRDSPPRSISHWDAHERVSMREVEAFSNRLEAEGFLAPYLRALERGSVRWTVFCEDVV